MNSHRERLDTAFAALADPTRRAILARLAKGDATVMELVEPFELTQPAITKHLKVLERAGLISRSRDGQTRPCKLETSALRDIDRWIGKFREMLEERYEALDEVLADLKREEQATKPRRKS
jgi:DNA-binding transcriptional ArsR family regulator